MSLPVWSHVLSRGRSLSDNRGCLVPGGVSGSRGVSCPTEGMALTLHPSEHND